MSEPTSIAASNAMITVTQKIAAVVGGAGMGLSVVAATEWLQLVGAATGAIVGLWMLYDKIIKATRKPAKVNDHE